MHTFKTCYASGEASALSTRGDGFESRAGRHFFTGRGEAWPFPPPSDGGDRWFKSSRSDHFVAKRPSPLIAAKAAIQIWVPACAGTSGNTQTHSHHQRMETTMFENCQALVLTPITGR
jgi:hypothetical protein